VTCYLEEVVSTKRQKAPLKAVVPMQKEGGQDFRVGAFHATQVWSHRFGHVKPARRGIC